MDNMSFLPEDYIERRAARRTNVLCLSLFVIVMLGLVGAFVVSSRHDAEVRELHRQVNKEFEEAARRIEQLEQLQTQKKQMIHKAQVTGVLLERVPRSLLMAELINHMPATLSLTELDLETRELRAANARPRTAIEREQQRLSQQTRNNDMFGQIDVPDTEMTVNLVGVAPTDVEVARFMTSLGRHNMFYDVNLLFSEQTTIREQRMRQFRIELKVDQDIDLTGMEPTLVGRELKQNPMGNRLRIDGSGELVAPGASVMPDWDQQ